MSEFFYVSMLQLQSVEVWVTPYDVEDSGVMLGSIESVYTDSVLLRDSDTGELVLIPYSRIERAVVHQEKIQEEVQE